MAESTPRTLGGLASAFMMGRATNRSGDVDQATERLAAQINKLADLLEGAAGRSRRTSQGSNSTPGPTQQSNQPGNGGAWTVGGVARSLTQQTGGSHRDEGAPSVTGSGWLGRGNGGHQGPGLVRGAATANPGAAAVGAGVGAAVIGGGALFAGMSTYNGNHSENQIRNDLIASQFTPGGGNLTSTYRSMFQNNYSAQDAGDLSGSQYMLAQRGGFTAGSRGYMQQSASAAAVSVVSPTISNSQAQAAQLSLGSVGSFNKMQALGITTMNKNGTVDVGKVARDILNKMPGHQNVKTQAQVDAAFGPAGSVTVTIQGMVANGYLPADAVDPVVEMIRGLLKAQIAGINASEFGALTRTAATHSNDREGSAARDRLRSASISNSLISRQREREGLGRERESETYGGFRAGVEQSTALLNKFSEALNAIMRIPAVGELIGYTGGVTGSLGGPISSIQSAMPGGGMAPTMSRGAVTGVGGVAPRQSGRTSAGGGGGGAQSNVGGAKASAGQSSGGLATSGTKFIAPRPGVDSMSSEQDFGTRTIGQGWHTGVDLLGPQGAAIKASAAGTVVGAGWGSSGDSGYGNTVMISHGGGYVTMYAHMLNISVNKGDSVRQGQIIGTVGDTGSYSQGAHLHFEIHINGKPVDPKPYIGGGKRAPISADGSAGAGVASAGTSASAGAGTGSSMGSTGGYANASGASSGYGAYSELGALALGAGGGAGAGSSSARTSAGGTSAGTAATSGAAGNVASGTRIATANLDWSRGNDKKQLAHLAAANDILLIQEANKTNLSRVLPEGWKTNQDLSNAGTMGSAIAWNAAKLGDSLGQSGLAFGSSQKGGNTRYISYVDTNVNGQAVRMISGHAPLTKYADPKIFQDNLKKVIEGRPEGAEWLVGTDGNSLWKGMGKALGGVQVGSGVVGQIHSKGLKGGSVNIDNYGMDKGLTDHAYVGQSISAQAPKSSGNGGSPAQNQALGRQMATAMGWGGQWDALKTLWTRESGWRTNADNPTSSAYGIPQALTALHHLDGTAYMTDPAVQIKWGLDYIKGKYGDPSKALNFWNKNNWYDSGEWNIGGDKDARVHKGEMILPTKVAEAVRNELTAPNGLRGGSGMQIRFEKDSIKVVMGNGATQRDARLAGETIVDTIVKDQRIKALAAGG